MTATFINRNETTFFGAKTDALFLRPERKWYDNFATFYRI